MKFMYSLLIKIENVLMVICADKSYGKKGKLAEIVLYYEIVFCLCIIRSILQAYLKEFVQ